MTKITYWIDFDHEKTRSCRLVLKGTLKRILMKNVKWFIIALATLILTAQTTHAQNYKQPFNVSEKGQVLNEQGVKLGWIEGDGTIKDAKGKIVGKVVKSELHNTTGKKMAEILADGSIKDADGKILYTISSADENGLCKILDASGREVGTVHQNYKQQGACALHCLGTKK